MNLISYKFSSLSVLVSREYCFSQSSSEEGENSLTGIRIYDEKINDLVSLVWILVFITVEVPG